MIARNERLAMLRESILLTEEILSTSRAEFQNHLDEDFRAKLIHARDWRRRYLSHLEGGGALLEPGDEWSMHIGHDLAVEWGYETWDENRIGLRCRSCEDWIQLYDVEAAATSEPTMGDL